MPMLSTPKVEISLLARKEVIKRAVETNFRLASKIYGFGHR
jgi:hypothetical protein